jgi:amino acid adenylation domain-containing protein
MIYPSLRYPAVHFWFEDQVKISPDAIAVICEGQSLTYEQLNAQANQLARCLEKRGVGLEKTVAIYLDRSPAMLVGLLGILKTGAAYLPVDPTMPRERQALMLNDAAPALLLTQSSLRDELPSATAPVFVIDAEGEALAAENAGDVAVPVAADALAYLMYTSGSTGVPKGVEIPHGALVNFLVSMQEQPGLVAEDVLVALTTLSFDIAALEIFLPLVTGARIVLLTRDEVVDGFQIARELQEQKATVLQATPSTWRMLLDAEWQGNPKLKMLCGGEALTRQLADQLLAKGGELWNMYGPTETTIWSATAKIEPGNDPITIGQPVANTQLYVLDPNGLQVPVGVPGELYIGGWGVARGYRNRAELTAEKFVADPFSKVEGARLYRTGDSARLRARGQIEVTGRLDFQVKIRGFRIELGEIESLLAKHPQVREVVVTAREDSPGHKHLVAYVTLKAKSPVENGTHAGAVPMPAELRQFLEQKLPDYMIPAFFEVLDALPLTPNGKVNRKALPAPKGPVTLESRPYVGPRNGMEAQLAEIWSEVLGREKVGVEDNIFEIGGDSLLIFRIAARARQAGIPLSVRQFFQHKTIALLASALEESPAQPKVPVGPQLMAVSRERYRAEL